MDAASVADFRVALAETSIGDGADGAACVDLIRSLEQLTGTIAAVQAEASVALTALRRREDAASGVPAARQGRGAVAEIALARRESPHRASSLVGMARALVEELPHTMARLRDGDLSPWRVTLVVRESACLDPEDRAEVDRRLCADPATLMGLGTRQVAGAAARLAVSLDPAAVTRRARRAETERSVSLRPAPDTMTYLTGLLPVAQGVAAFAALTREADALVAAGDPRGRGQLMADLLVTRVTGQPLGGGRGTDGSAPRVSVGVNVTISDLSLFGAGHEPATVHAPQGVRGVPPVLVPAELARHLVASSVGAGLATWIRRLYADPAGELVALSTRQRCHTDGLADFLDLRDQGICRTPWCDAPIRHHDHVRPFAEGGATTAENGQGLCQACNHAKQSPCWSQQADRPTGGRHVVHTITPTGHSAESRAPALPGHHEPAWRLLQPGVYVLAV